MLEGSIIINKTSKTAGAVLYAIGQWVFGFAIISFGTFLLIQAITHYGFVIAAAIALFVAVLYLLNHKTYQRERFFESQIVTAKTRRHELDIPHYSPKSYQYYLRSSNWATLAKFATDAMDGKCEFCGKQSSAVHHVYYPKDRSNLGLENIASLCVVCKKCHDVLHGIDAQCGNKCALCQKINGTKNLAIKINQHGKLQQLVCGRCKSIATGFRDEANKWSLTKYRQWIHEWQESMFADLLRQQAK